MSNFAGRLFTQSFKLLLRICFILGGIVFVSMARAIWHMVSSGSTNNDSDQGMTVEDAHRRGFIDDDELSGTLPDTKIF